MTLTRTFASWMTMNRRPMLAALLSVAALNACTTNPVITDDTDPPVVSHTAGALLIQLDTPSSDDGAVQVVVTGPEIDSVRVAGYSGFGSSTATSAQMIATGLVRDGLIARVYVKDLSRQNEYHVAVVAAAARSTYLLQDLQGYSASISKQ